MIGRLRYRLSEYLLRLAHDDRYYDRWHDILENWGYRMRPRNWYKYLPDKPTDQIIIKAAYDRLSDKAPKK